ncbi:MAG: hypothetical protein EA422_04930 [Gemmatimonadales bacterium]|nr:MAG: hypothetical protein EA422_04930 [Gemmatimonadales bacterium]
MTGGNDTMHDNGNESSAGTDPTISEEGAAAVRGVILTHGGLADGLVDAVARIAGDVEGALVPVSNTGCGPEALMERVTSAVGTGPALVFTDLPAGSCALAARVACRDPGLRRVLFGVNLPMLLDFVFHRNLPLDELVDRLVFHGRSAIQAYPPSSAIHGHHPPAR